MIRIILATLLLLAPGKCISDELLSGPYPHTLSRLAFTAGDCLTQPEIEKRLKSANSLEDLYRPLWDMRFLLSAYGPDINLSHNNSKDAPIGAALYVDLTYQLTELEAIIFETKLARVFAPGSNEHSAFVDRIIVFYRRIHGMRLDTYLADQRLQSPTLEWGIRACKLYRERALTSLRELHATTSARQDGGGNPATRSDSKSEGDKKPQTEEEVGAR
jgi:hypothetical protein